MHRFREVSRLPITVVRSVCDCGCKLQRLELVTEDGRRSIPIDVPIRRVNPKTIERAVVAMDLGRDLLTLWGRIKSLVPH